ncbi:MAG: hypothetical protein ACTSRZ_07915 [Promethearchaeota archaeon]
MEDDGGNISPIKIIKLFQSEDEEDHHKAFRLFLGRTHWNFDGTPEFLKNYACKQLNLNPDEVWASDIKYISPNILWASQDAIQEEKLIMVELAYEYCQRTGNEMPPVVCWDFFSSNPRYILMDGHHRTYFCYKKKIKVKAVLLEPLANYYAIEKLFQNAFRIRTRVIYLPIVRLSPLKIEEIDFTKIRSLTKQQIKDLTPNQLKKMFQSEDTIIREIAYMAFLSNSLWGVTFDIDRGVRRILMDLKLPLYEGKGLDYRQRRLNPKLIWASEDSLDKNRLDMIMEAFKYMIKYNKPIPPVAVWQVRDAAQQLIAHDGHHRIYVANQLGIDIPAVVLEYWIDNRENPLLERKIPYTRINKKVINLPVEKFTTKIY